MRQDQKSIAILYKINLFSPNFDGFYCVFTLDFLKIYQKPPKPQTGDERISLNSFSILVLTHFCELEYPYADPKSNLKI